ncbi:MAG: glycogen/starch/alpha-glucan phosphorylase, partial [Ruminococcaceae bacterium]|nr:glycogen/starch/alpha-glucan phosphorylase [Oscillospiraceae bacterium]
MKETFKNNVYAILRNEFARNDLKSATVNELYHAVSRAAISASYDTVQPAKDGKRACYFSAEFLVGRLIYDNLNNLGLNDAARELLGSEGIDFSVFEEIEDAALGNGGLGRLAACFLDSAATHSVPLDGYGIRYRYGLFRQFIENGFQREQADVWQNFGDPWSFRRDEDSVIVEFAGSKVKAVPYDTPVIGFGGKCVNTLRLWQSEPVEEFNFDTFNQNKREEAFAQRNAAEQISAVLYPNDGTYEGRQLRLKQQYFFCSASLQSILKKYKAKHGSDFSRLPEEFVVQLNDTHPVCSIPELLRLLVDGEGLSFDEAFAIARSTFAYTNHTVMPEALEKWEARLIFDTIPQIYDFIILIDRRLRDDLRRLGISGEEAKKYHIVDNGLVHMARLAVYATFSTNGVAWLHTEILKDSCLGEWYRIYPERFNNKTNGITQRRWLSLCNPGLSAYITELIGDGWITSLDELKKLEKFADDEDVLRRIADIKLGNKQRLADHVLAHDGAQLDSSFIFDIQVKRLHEYKRQFLNALSILDIYYGIKDGRIKNFAPTAYIFGAKAFPTYRRAKGIVKLIGEIARLVDSDPEVSKYLKVLFVSNY